MINEARLRKYCCDNISLIENYNEAVNDTTQRWQCHHKLEITLHKTRQELIEMGLYYNRPASELIFLTHSEHSALHMSGSRNPMYGKNFEDFMTDEAIKERCKKISESNKDKPKLKYKWLTPTGEIRIMNIANAHKHHPDWIIIGEV